MWLQTIHLLLIVTLLNNLECIIFEAGTAFLNGYLAKEIFMDFKQGMEREQINFHYWSRLCVD